MTRLAKGVVVAVGAAVVAATVPSSPPSQVVEQGEASALPAPPVQVDPRVRAFTQAYGALIDSVASTEGDFVFYMAGRPIAFDDGRMVERGRGSSSEACDPIFYRYSLEPLTHPEAAPEEMPVYCTHFLEALWGDDETEIRRHGASVSFLDHRMFVNELLVEPLAAVERDLRGAAQRDAGVADWVEGLDVTYSYIHRDIAGSPTQSHHAWGLAVDFVPSSYGGRAVYWRWSRVYDREGWDRIPLERRWSPPLAVVQIFERHGFVWGGKWAHFDVIHFEYRPEIIIYNRMISGRGS